MLSISPPPVVTPPPPPPPPPPTSSNFINWAQLGTPGNSPYGNPSYLGMSITVGPSNLLVTALGRWMIAGNKLTHKLAIFDASSKLQVGTTLSVSLPAPVGAFLYASYPTGVILQAGRTYYIVSTEQAYDPHDTLYGTDSAYLTASDATLNGAILQGSQDPQFSTWQLTPGNKTYGPVDFLYTTTTTMATLPGSPWSLYEYLGMDQASVSGWWDHALSELYILAQPIIHGAGVLYSTQYVTVCKGTVTLALTGFLYDNSPPPTDTVMGQWWLDGVAIGPVQTAQVNAGGQTQFLWDTTQVTDGTHVLTWEVIAANSQPAAIYKSSAICVVVGNKGFSTVAQDIVLSSTFYKFMPTTPEVVHFNGTPNSTLPTVPFSPVTCPSANGVATSLLAEAVAEPVHVSSGAYQVYNSGPRWITSPKGQGVYPIGNIWNGLANSLDADGANFDSIMPALGLDGPRLDNLSHGFTTYVDALDGTGWWGLSLDGRLFKRTFAGTITTVAGRLLNRADFHWDNTDLALSEPSTPSGSDATLNTRATIVGDWSATPGGNNSGWWLKNGTDLCVDPRNLAVVYVVLQVPSVIMRVDTSTSPATITLYAGVLQADHTNVNGVGYVDGPVATAEFSEPSSIIMADGTGKTGPLGTMYIADFNNGAIRAIDPSGTTVSTVAGGTFSTQPPPTAPIYAPSAAGTVSTASNFIAYPYWVRFTSTGTIVLVESYSLTTRELDLSAGTLRHIGTFQGQAWRLSQAPWTAFDVDRYGSIGPVDRIYQAYTQGDVPMEYIDLTGSNRTPWLQIGSSEIEMASGTLIGAGYYPWMFAIHRSQCRAIATFLDDGPITYELRGPPHGPDTVAASTHAFNAMVKGWINFRYGTCGIWFPFNSRPSFLLLYGDTGQCRLGLSDTNLTFDELDANFPSTTPGDAGDVALGNFIRAGMIGGVPRPELTGNDMNYLIYFIRRNTLRGGQPNPTAATPSISPAADDPDTGNYPVISGVSAVRNSATSITVSWTTDKPTIGLAGGTTPAQAAQGQLMRYGVFSPIEDAFGTSHSVTISGLPAISPTHYVAVSKDYAGNCSHSPDMSIV